MIAFSCTPCPLFADLAIPQQNARIVLSLGLIASFEAVLRQPWPSAPLSEVVDLVGAAVRCTESALQGGLVSLRGQPLKQQSALASVASLIATVCKRITRDNIGALGWLGPRGESSASFDLVTTLLVVHRPMLTLLTQQAASSSKGRVVWALRGTISQTLPPYVEVRNMGRLACGFVGEQAGG